MDEYAKIIKIFEKQKADKKTADEIIKSLQEKFTVFKSLKKTFTEEFAETRRKIEAELREKEMFQSTLKNIPL